MKLLDAKALYVGGTPVKAVYLGDKEVWRKSSGDFVLEGEITVAADSYNPSLYGASKFFSVFGEMTPEDTPILTVVWDLVAGGGALFALPIGTDYEFTFQGKTFTDWYIDEEAFGLVIMNLTDTTGWPTSGTHPYKFVIRGFVPPEDDPPEDE